MRRSTTALALAAVFALAGCGGDEPEQTEIPRPTTTQRPVAPDTTLGDTAAGAARPGTTAARPGQPGGQPGQGGQAGQAGRAGGQVGGQAGAADAQPGATARTGSRLYTVQVAAFESPDSARKWTGRLSSLDLPVWTSMAELGGTTYYRVRVGAVSSVADARRLGALLSQRFEWPVWVAPVTPSDRMPEGAVASTRRVLGGD